MSVVLSSNKSKVRQSFDSAANSYDEFALLQKQVSIDLLAKINTDFVDDVVVDIGCGTGFLIQQLMQRSAVRQLIAVDIAFSMLQVARTKFNNVQYVCVDAEMLPVQNDSVDKIVSNLALQWCQNLTRVFNGFNRALKQQGQILFSTFGPATLQELKQAWAEVDNYSHVNNFHSIDELTVFLQQAEFRNIKIEAHRYQSHYRNVIELMRELKATGAHNVLTGLNRKTTRKSRMQNMTVAYEKYRVNGFLPATYEILFVSADS